MLGLPASSAETKRAGAAATTPPDWHVVITRVAERHSRRELNIAPALYAPFINSLIDTVRQFDREFTPAVEAAWRATVAPGVEYMQRKHAGSKG